MDICTKILNQITTEGAYANNRMFDMSIWDWSQGVALFGVWKYYQETKEEKYLSWLEEWFNKHLALLPQNETINTMTPYLTLAFMFEHTGNEEYGRYCEKAAHWLVNELPRTEMKGFQHSTIDSLNEQQLWADTVFVAVLFLAKYGKLVNNVKYQEEAKRQYLLHIAYLMDKDTGLWNHGWSFIRKDNYACAHWARGNCWFTMAVVELLEIWAMADWAMEWIVEAYRNQVNSLLKLQDKSGLWHTLVDHSDSYLEISGSCGFLYGMLKGIRLGILPEAYKEAVYKGLNTAISFIREDGIVDQVSWGTVLSDSIDYYKQVKISPTGYGQNLMLMLLVEARKHSDAFK